MAKVSRHELSVSGRSGAIFWFLTAAAVVCALGFATPAWYQFSTKTQEGLWQDCQCGENGRGDDWFRAVQAMMALGLLSLLICTFLAMIYQFCHCCDMNCTLIVAGVFAALAVVANIIGLTIYGVKFKEMYGTSFHYSFYFECVGTVFGFIATILCFLQYCKSN